VRQKVVKLLSAEKLQGVMMSINESILQDFNTIVSHVPPEQCLYLYDCVTKSMNDETKHYTQKLRIKAGEFIASNFTFCDNYEHLTKLLDSLSK
jgi:hypothetical protein